MECVNLSLSRLELWLTKSKYGPSTLELHSGPGVSERAIFTFGRGVSVAGMLVILNHNRIATHVIFYVIFDVGEI